jgi:hypothetical protein
MTPVTKYWVCKIAGTDSRRGARRNAYVEEGGFHCSIARRRSTRSGRDRAMSCVSTCPRRRAPPDFERCREHRCFERRRATIVSAVEGVRIMLASSAGSNANALRIELFVTRRRRVAGPMRRRR